jgi:hypothetical protein
VTVGRPGARAPPQAPSKAAAAAAAEASRVTVSLSTGGGPAPATSESRSAARAVAGRRFRPALLPACAGPGPSRVGAAGALVELSCHLDSALELELRWTPNRTPASVRRAPAAAAESMAAGTVPLGKIQVGPGGCGESLASFPSH